MIRATNHSSYPRVGSMPLDQQLRTTIARFERGAVEAAAVDEAAETAIALCVAEQSRAFIDIVTDGQVRWEGPLSHVAAHLDGLERAEIVRWFETNFYDRRVVVRGPITRRGPFLVADYLSAASVAQRPVKIVLPGPATFARRARDEHYGDVDRLADALAGALGDETAALREAGATVFQVDEPALCRHPEDLERTARCAARIFEAAGPAATTILSTYFGDLAASAGRLAELPGTHLGLDLTWNDANAGLLARLPADRGVMLGLFDARTTRQEDAAEVAAALAPYRETLVGRDVLVGPSAGLELLPRDQAFDKLLHARYLVETLAEEWTWPS